jgi:hypothetical protein
MASQLNRFENPHDGPTIIAVGIGCEFNHACQDGVERPIAPLGADRIRLLVSCDIAPDHFPVRPLFFVAVDQLKHRVHTLLCLHAG